MLSASELGEASATFDLIEAGIRSASLTLQAYAAPLQRLGLLAKKDGHRQAMVLLGKVLLSQQKELEALEWFRKASQGPSESLDFEGAAEALVNEGRILLEQKDEEGAGAAFRKAAVDLDDPTGYFYLSKLADPDSPQQQVYLLKAASAGIVEAWHNLGSLELARLQAQPAPPKTFQDFGMAREWFQVAAADGFGLSMLNLALMCKAVGQPGAGMEWLEKAETVPEVREQARSLKAQWRSEKVELS
jgi:TPR repeat protein